MVVVASHFFRWLFQRNLPLLLSDPAAMTMTIIRTSLLPLQLLPACLRLPRCRGDDVHSGLFHQGELGRGKLCLQVRKGGYDLQGKKTFKIGENKGENTKAVKAKHCYNFAINVTNNYAYFTNLIFFAELISSVIYLSPFPIFPTGAARWP